MTQLSEQGKANRIQHKEVKQQATRLFYLSVIKNQRAVANPAPHAAKL
jgi:hypothetical protein